MSVKDAKFSLEMEVKDVHTDIQTPLKLKYARWKIIDYLWGCYLSKESDGDSIDWLKELYRESGMSEKNLDVFVHEIELMMETIQRKPLKNN